MSEQCDRNPRCPRCGGALKFDTCIVGGDDMYAVEDEAVCMSCSRRFAQLKLPPEYRDIPIASVKGNAGTYFPPDEPRQPRATKPCRVDGCEEKTVYYSKSGLCGRCAKRLKVWQDSQRMVPAPFVPHPDCTDMLIRNPEREMQHVR